MIRCPRCASPHPDSFTDCHCGYAVSYLQGFRAWAPQAARSGEHYDPAFFSALAELEAHNFWFRARNALIVAMLRRYAPKLESFLEVGCGTGFVLAGVGEAFPHARLVGSELFVDALPIAARRNPGAELVQMDARAIPYDQAFDVVSAFDVLEHIVEDQHVIENLSRAVRPGGVLMASVPQHPSLWSHSDEIGHHVRRYRRRELEHKVTAAGLTVLRSTSFVSLLLPAMFLSRSMKPKDPLAELRVPRSLNALMEGVMAAERWAILAGVKFPIGGSRLVIAQRPV